MGIKILLVEDDELNSDMLSRRLKKNGYDVRSVTTGEEALQMAKEELPALILMDMGLPGMDGWEATQKLKLDPKTKDIPVIALTAHSLKVDRAKAIEAGCADFDTKPIEFLRLIGKIEKVLQK